MINALLHFSLRNRLLVMVLAVALLVYGGLTAVQLPVDVFPDLNRPTVTIMTEAHGMAPEEVETLVTLPLETVLNGAPGVRRVRSNSGIGLSIVFAEFDWDTDIYQARQLVAERLQLVRERLPEAVVPAMGPVSSIMGEILLIGLRSQSVPPMETRTLADWTLRPRLMSIPGIAQVIAIGGEVKQLQVLASPAKMRQLDISLAQLEETIRSANQNNTGGFLEIQSQEYLIRNISRVQSPAELANTVIAERSGSPILIGHVATVDYGAQVKRGDASVNAAPAVILSVQKQPGANTVDLTRQIEATLQELQSALPAGVAIEILFRQANFIETSIHNVQEALRDGALLVLLILLLFLWNGRTTVITLTAIPLSFAVTALFFKATDTSINTMTLGGLAVAIGELVDDAIVDVENIFRRLKENRLLPAPRPPLAVIFAASVEIRNSIVYATVIVVLVFIPLLALSGIEGRLFNPLAMAYIVSLLASLLVSLTVTPVLSYYLLPRAPVIAHQDSWVVRHLKAWNTRLLELVLPRPLTAVGLVGILVAVSLALVPLMGREFLPPFNEGTATISLLASPGTSLGESNHIGTIAEKLLLEVPEVQTVGRRTGRAEQDEHAEGVHYSELDVDFKPSPRNRAAILEDIRAQLAQIPGVAVNIGQPISHRLDHLLSGVRAQIVVKLFGPDLPVLREQALAIAGVMQGVPGVVDLQVEKQVLIPQVAIRMNREAARQHEIQLGHLMGTLETALNGKVVSQVLDNQRRFDILVRLEASSRDSVEALRNLSLQLPTGPPVPLSTVADIRTTQGPNVINRENIQRRIVISCNTAGRDLGAIVGDIQQAIRTQVHLPPGYFPTYEGQFQSQQEATRRIVLLSLLSLAGICLVLSMQFRSGLLVAQILLTIPMALVGAVLAIFLTGGVFSVASLIGFIALTGISARNSIMKVSHYLHLMQEEGETFSPAMVIRGSNERLIPVLMTAAATGFALVPLAISIGAPGKEILQPMAVVILGGLLSATLLDALVTPAVFLRFAGPAVERYLRRREEIL